MAPRAFEAAEPALNALDRESPDVLVTHIFDPFSTTLGKRQHSCGQHEVRAMLWNWLPARECRARVTHCGRSLNAVSAVGSDPDETQRLRIESTHENADGHERTQSRPHTRRPPDRECRKRFDSIDCERNIQLLRLHILRFHGLALAGDPSNACRTVFPGTSQKPCRGSMVCTESKPLTDDSSNKQKRDTQQQRPQVFRNAFATGASLDTVMILSAEFFPRGGDTACTPNDKESLVGEELYKVRMMCERTA